MSLKSYKPVLDARYTPLLDLIHQENDNNLLSFAFLQSYRP